MENDDFREYNIQVRIASDLGFDGAMTMAGMEVVTVLGRATGRLDEFEVVITERVPGSGGPDRLVQSWHMEPWTEGKP